MVRNEESSETMMPVMIEKMEDTRSGISSLDVGLYQARIQRASVSEADKMWKTRTFIER